MEGDRGQAGQQPAEPAPGTPTCDVCGKAAEPGRKLQRCSVCLSARYCSSACQRAAWPAHKGPCKRTSRLDVHRASPLLAAAAYLPRLSAPPDCMRCEVYRRELRGRELHVYLRNRGPQRQAPEEWDRSGSRVGPSVAQLHMMASSCGYAEATTLGALYGFHCAVQRYNARVGGAGTTGGERVVLTCKDSKLVEYGIAVGPHNPDYVMVFHEGGQVTHPQDPANHVWMYFSSDRSDQLYLDVASLPYGMGLMLDVIPYLPDGTPESQVRAWAPCFGVPGLALDRTAMALVLQDRQQMTRSGRAVPDGSDTLLADLHRVPLSGTPAADPRAQLTALLRRVRDAGTQQAPQRARQGQGGGAGGGRGGGGGGPCVVPFRDGPLEEHVEWAVRCYECALRNTAAVLEQGKYKHYPASLDGVRCLPSWASMPSATA